MKLVMPLIYQVKHFELQMYEIQIIPTEHVVVIDSESKEVMSFRRGINDITHRPIVKMLFDVKVFRNGVFKMNYPKLWLTEEEYFEYKNDMFNKHIAEIMSIIFDEEIKASEIEKINWRNR
jgi:hypothetical protein